VQKLTKVILWKGRTDPAHRVIPAHLKLAILSRGSLPIAADAVTPFLDIARASGATWPDRLTGPLGDAGPAFPVTFELFQNQRLTLTPNEISEAIDGYLVLRRKNELSDSCWLLIYSWVLARDRTMLERRFDVDLGELFRRPHVTVRSSDDPFRYLLVYYVCLPLAVSRLVAPAKPRRSPSPLPPRPTGKPSILGVLKPNTELHFRDGPSTSAKSLGVQAGTAARVTVKDKQKTDGGLWYQFELADPARIVPEVGDPLTKASILPAGTSAWAAASALDILVVDWALVRNDLAEFDTANSSLSLAARITALRQRLHAKNLPFDVVIGTGHGKVYLDDIPFDAGRWQLGRDYQAFIAPDGRWVDLQHLAVAMDVLDRREDTADFLKIPIGTNYAAATWSGDVGAAAADATLHVDASTWERWNPTATAAARLQYYFAARASEHDLLGDVDGWGVQEVRRQNRGIEQIDGLIALYYEETAPGGERTLTVQRRVALERFLKHYGFTYDAARDFPNYPVFPRQNGPMGRFLREINLFGSIWMLRRNPNLTLSHDPNAWHPSFVGDMTVQLVWWLEQQTIENGAEV
jgi:hypothetical protein